MQNVVTMSQMRRGLYDARCGVLVRQSTRVAVNALANDFAIIGDINYHPR